MTTTPTTNALTSRPRSRRQVSFCVIHAALLGSCRGVARLESAAHRQSELAHPRCSTS